MHHKTKRIVVSEAKQMHDVLNLSKWEFLRIKRAEFEANVKERIR